MKPNQTNVHYFISPDVVKLSYELTGYSLPSLQTRGDGRLGEGGQVV